MSRIIYYPFINLPERAWTYRQLLYFDEIATIVPEEFLENPDYYPSYMLEMVREGLVTSHNFGYDYELQNELRTGFINYLRGINLKSRRMHSTDRNRVPHSRSGYQNRVVSAGSHIYSSKFRGGEALLQSQIYQSKFGPDIIGELTELDLAVRGDDGIIYMERTTAFELMRFLASLIGDRIDAKPTTNIIPPYAISDNENVRVREAGDKRDAILSRIMPMPQVINYVSMMRFRERHRGLLENFRNRIEEVVLNENIKPGTPLFDVTIERLLDQSNEITRRMEERSPGKVLKYSVRGMVPTAVTAILEGGITKTSGTVTLFAAIACAIHKLRRRDVDNSSGMKYLALANRHFYKTVEKQRPV